MLNSTLFFGIKVKNESYHKLGDDMIYGKMKRRAKVVFVCFSLFFLLIGFKLGYLQWFSFESLKESATTLWQRSFPIIGNRGKITDKNGVVLATNKTTASLIIVPSQVQDKKQCATILATIVNSDALEIETKISKKVSMVRIARHLNETQVSQINALQMNGVYLLKDSKRYYPYGHCLSQVLGFTGIDNQGLVGIELIYDDLLSSQNGSLNYYMDAKGQMLSLYPSDYQSPTSGYDISLTIDSEIQEIIEREVINAYLKYNPDGMWVIAMDPNSGAILGMSSKPDYNPNDYQSYDSTLYNQNTPIFKSYEPGSVFKILTFAAGLNENLFDMDQDYYNDIGYEYVSGTRIKSWKVGGHGYQSFREVLQNSSNPGFVEIASRLGKDKIYEYVNKFGLTSKTGIDLPGENQGIMFAYDNFHPLEQATVCFGQGISVTAMQLVRAVSACVNGGYLYQPYIVDEIKEPLTGEVISKTEPKLINQVISEETSMKMRDALETVVTDGGGKSAYIEGYRIGGKTGTAQKAVNGSYVDGGYILSFVGIAPIDNPKIVLYVAMDNPKNCVQYGGTTVAPIARNMLSQILPAMGIQQVENQREKVKSWDDIPTYQVDNYIGKTKDEVKSNVFDFIYKGEGDLVISQYPTPGTKLEVNSTIMIQLGGKNDES